MMSVENEFLENIKLLERLPSDKRDYSGLYKLISKMIVSDKKIFINNFNQDIVSFLYRADEGKIWFLAKNILSGFNQSMIIPKIRLNETQIVARTSSRPYPVKKNLFNEFKFSKISKKMVSKTPRQSNDNLLSDRELLPKLAASKTDQFFYCYSKNGRNQASSMSYTISETNKPPNHDTVVRTINQSGFFRAYNDKAGEFVELGSFLKDKEHFQMIRMLPVFQNWHRNKAFLKWHSLFRAKRHKKLILSIKQKCPFESPVFLQLFMNIREKVYNVLTSCHPIDPKVSTENFHKLKMNSEQSLASMKKSILDLNQSIFSDVKYFFQQLRGISTLLQSDFDVLKAVGALPPSLLPFSFDHQKNSPSISAFRIRNQLLSKERRLSTQRTDYIPQFYLLIELFFRGFKKEKYEITLKEFYNRFILSPPQHRHKIEIKLSEYDGICFDPSCSDFMKWFNDLEESIKSAYMSNHDINVQDENIHDFLFLSNNSSEKVSNEVHKVREDAINEIMLGYDLFEKRNEQNKEMFRDYQRRIDEIKAINDYESIDIFIQVLQEFGSMTTKVESQQRMIEYGSFFADLKSAKVALLGKLKQCVDRLKQIGSKKANILFDEVSIKRKQYLQEISTQFSVNESLMQDIYMFSNDHIKLVSSILELSPEGCYELQEQLVSVKEIFNVSLSGLKRIKGSSPDS